MRNALKIACIGGGTGLSSLLSGIKEYASKKLDSYAVIDMDNLAAIVSVSDDGGSSGRLIEEFDMLPPGDIRKLLFTLSDADELLADLFEYRFASNGELGGHTIGNLLLTALTSLKGGSFPKAIQAASELLNVRGRIIPVSLDCTVLCAELADGEIVRGESAIPKRVNREPIKHVFLEPRVNGINGKPQHPPHTPYECTAHLEAVDAIENSDVIIIGPGSLYTSIMPNLVVKGIADAIQASKAMKIYICNVMTQPGETDGYSVTGHVNAILNHTNLSLDYLIVNNQQAPEAVIQKYVQKELLEQFSRIKSYAEEGLDMLAEDTENFTEVLNLAKHISQLSDETKHVADASKVQVFYDANRDGELKKNGLKVIEADLIRERVVVESGIKMTVIRHDPEKLARALIKALNDHPKLHESV